MSLEHSLIF